MIRFLVNVSLKPAVTKKEQVINKNSKSFDYAILNQWVENGAKIKGVKLNENGSYMFNQNIRTIINLKLNLLYLMLR